MVAHAKDLKGRDLLDLAPLSQAAVLELFQTAKAMKRNITPFRKVLDGKTAVLIFEKASLRTRLTFEAGFTKLGGHAIYMDHSAQRLGDRESVKDYGKNLERWCDCIVARVYSQRIVEELAEHTKSPVINALSDRYHPCQGLADLFTLWERPGGLGKGTKRARLAYIGDGNNVCHSLMQCATLLGVDMTVITPKGYEPDPEVVAYCEAQARINASRFAVTHEVAAVEGHDAVYTDVWVSMGQADTAGKRRKVFAKYQVNADVMERASKGRAAPALFMHCLPAQRGVEVTDEVIDAPSSVVYDQAENRMQAQNALLAHVLGK